MRLLLCAVGLVWLAGCSYMSDRTRDLADVGRISIGTSSLGVGIEGKLTGFLHPSLGVASSNMKVGWDTRSCTLFWTEKETYFPFSMPMEVAEELAGANPLRATFLVFYAREPTSPGKDCTSVSRLFFSPPPGSSRQNMGRSWHAIATTADFEAGFSAVLVSARVGVNLAELVDFMLGFALIDIAGDDVSAQPAGLEEEQTES